MMKKLLMIFSVTLMVIGSTATLKAQNYLTVCGTVVGANGTPVTVHMVDSTTGQQWTTVTDVNGNFCDSVNPTYTQGFLMVYITDCNGNIASQSFTYFPGNQNFTLTFMYCNFLQTNVGLCVTVSNLPLGVPVMVFVQTAPTMIYDTLVFNGPGTVTLCDTLMVNNMGGTVTLQMQDCNGTNTSQTLTYGPGNMNLSSVFDYCPAVQNFVTYCITMNNIPGGLAVPVVMYDSIQGISTTLNFPGMGSYTICDTVWNTGNSGQLYFYFYDCNGAVQANTFSYGPGNYSASYNWDYCPQGGGGCYSYFTTTYDSTSNTFYVTVDSLTMSQAVTYNWNFGDNTTSTLPNPTHQYNSLSLYNVCLTITTANGNVCTYCHNIGFDSLGNVVTKLSSGFNLVVLPQGPTGISQNESSMFEVYPNPVKDILTVKSTSLTAEISVYIYSVNGEKVIEENNTGLLQLNLSQLKQGMYFARIVNGSVIENVKLIKQ